MRLVIRNDFLIKLQPLRFHTKTAFILKNESGFDGKYYVKFVFMEVIMYMNDLSAGVSCKNLILRFQNNLDSCHSNETFCKNDAIN